jgi:hypothetical protein
MIARRMRSVAPDVIILRGGQIIELPDHPDA